MEWKGWGGFSKSKKSYHTIISLALPNLFKPFCIECDVLGKLVGAVLMQQWKPIAFLIQALKGKILSLSTYEKEFYALVMAIQKWRPYLLGRPFIIKTDYYSLKHLLDQKYRYPYVAKVAK